MALLALKAAAVCVIIKTVGYNDARKIINAMIQPAWPPWYLFACSQHTMVLISAKTIIRVIKAEDAARPFLFATIESADHCPRSVRHQHIFTFQVERQACCYSYVNIK